MTKLSQNILPSLSLVLLYIGKEVLSLMAQTIEKTYSLQICITNPQPWVNIFLMKPYKNNWHTIQNILGQLCSTEIQGEPPIQL